MSSGVSIAVLVAYVTGLTSGDEARLKAWSVAVVRRPQWAGDEVRARRTSIVHGEERRGRPQAGLQLSGVSVVIEVDALTPLCQHPYMTCLTRSVSAILPMVSTAHLNGGTERVQVTSSDKQPEL